MLDLRSGAKLADGGKRVKIGVFGTQQGIRIVALLVILTIGCREGDSDRLARIGHKVADRAEVVAGDPNGKLAQRWQAVRGAYGEAGLDARVAVRLRWDKELAESQIEVSATGSTVELRGTVGDLNQRRRAVMLAETTAGVEKVTDALQVAE
jgi:hypothetical protein